MKYYLHDSNAFNDEKITELYIKFGYEGLGLFYTILEKLAGQEKPIKTVVLKKQLNVGKKLNKCWKFMESLDIISSNNGETFNKQLLNFSEKYQVKKQKNAKRISQWRENQANSENVTRSKSVRNNLKDKISKDKISKVSNGKQSLHAEMKEIFMSGYKAKFGNSYYWTVKDGSALKQLITKIQSKESKDVAGDFKVLLNSVKDKWILDNFSVSIINSKFNELVTKGKSEHRSLDDIIQERVS